MLARLATPTDAPAIGRIQVAAWRERLSAWAPPWFVARFKEDEAAAKYAERIASGLYVVMVVEHDSEVLSFASYKPNETEPLAYSHQIGAVYTYPLAERRGAATAALEALLAHARAQGIEKLVLWTFRDNQPARRLYEKVGGRLLPYTDAADMDLDIPHVSYGWEFNR